ncbi:hypothetical protein G3M53_90280, partial [Streptomyces sp. SID7982]|nr:hypothetical protein [Streptomyces sp. SID7982]
EAPTDPGPDESSDDFGDPPPEEPWEYEEGVPEEVAPEPTQVFPAEPEEPDGPDAPAEPDAPMEADLGDVFAG